MDKEGMSEIMECVTTTAKSLECPLYKSTRNNAFSPGYKLFMANMLITTKHSYAALSLPWYEKFFGIKGFEERVLKLRERLVVKGLEPKVLRDMRDRFRSTGRCY